MWLFSYHPLLCCLLPTIAISLALAPQNGDGSLMLTNPSSLPPSLNFSAVTAINAANNTSLSTATDQTLGHDRHVICEISIYGHPPVASCMDAIKQIPVDPRWFRTSKNPTLTFGQRGQGTWDFDLPKRFISSDGLCIYDFTQTSSPSHVKFVDDLQQPLRALEQECVEKEVPPCGGRANHFGQEGNFGILVREFHKPFTRCFDTPPAAQPVSSACQKIIDTMDVGTDQITFGAQGVEDVQVHLPMVLTDPTNTCAFHIDITAPDDKSSWYDMWQVAVALDGVCARIGKTGKSRLLGANRKITIEVKKS